MIENFKKELFNQQQELLDKFVISNDLIDTWKDCKAATIKATIPSLSTIKTKSMMDKDNWDKENSRLKNNKIREILMALELGANRQELNDMISKLMDGDA